MDPFTMATLVLGDLEMTSGQLAQMRAINTKYFTELAALERRAARGSGAGGAETGGEPVPAVHDLLALHARIAADIRDLLTASQRIVFDRNFPAVWAREIGPQLPGESGEEL